MDWENRHEINRFFSVIATMRSTLSCFRSSIFNIHESQQCIEALVLQLYRYIDKFIGRGRKTSFSLINSLNPLIYRTKYIDPILKLIFNIFCVICNNVCGHPKHYKSLIYEWKTIMRNYFPNSESFCPQAEYDYI